MNTNTLGVGGLVSTALSLETLKPLHLEFKVVGLEGHECDDLKSKA